MNENELRKLVNEFAADLAHGEAVTSWDTWLIYLCECLEEEAQDLDPDGPDGIERCFASLQEALSARLKTHQW